MLIRIFVPVCNFAAVTNSKWSSSTRRLISKQRMLDKKHRKHPTEANRKWKWSDCSKNARISKRNDIFSYESKILNSGNQKKFFNFLRSKMKVKEDIVCISDERANLLVDDSDKASNLTNISNRFFVGIIIFLLILNPRLQTTRLIG
jgi:hypothetical protein